MKYYEYLCNKEMQLAYAKANGVPARYSALKDPSLNRGYFDVILESLEKTRFEPLVPYYLEQHDIMNNYLSAIMTGVMSSDKAMKLAQEELNVLYSEY
jgi:ABC-type glycerol-3-phosphate transport system substrate-binding protein